jgi:hypothetical protein
VHDDIFVRLEVSDFERAGADWMAAHITRRSMAGVNWGKSLGEPRQKESLPPLVEAELPNGSSHLNYLLSSLPTNVPAAIL